MEAAYSPLRLEDFAERGDPFSGEGPRLAIGGLAENLTLDLGTVALTVPLEVTLPLANVGDEALVISRIYPGSGGRALAFVVGGRQLDQAGFPASPIVVPPGEGMDLQIMLDPTRLTHPGTRALHLQMFTNDPRHELFDPSDENSHEARLRLVLDAQPMGELRRPIGPDELPVAPGAPRLWIPQLANSGRGGDLLRIGTRSADEPLELELTVANLGSTGLAIVSVQGAGIEGELASNAVSPGAAVPLRLIVTPAPHLDRGRWIRRTLQLRSNDPVAPLIEVTLSGAWEEVEGESSQDG